MTGNTAILLMAYGSPSRVEDVPEYLSDIYEGKPVPEYAMDENLRKYRMVDGVSPSNATIDSLRERLEKELSDHGMSVYLGNKHWHPRLDATLEEMKKDSVSRIVAIPLFPFPSGNVKNSYMDPAMKSMARMNYSPEIEFVNGFNEYSLFSETWAEILKEELKSSGEETQVVYSAHSLPLFRNSEDSYNDAYIESAKNISQKTGLKTYSYGYQSRGKYGDRWLGPLLLEVFETLQGRGIEEILAAPIGFCYEHLEILYDLDIEFGEYVKDMGMDYRRTPLPDYRNSWVRMFRDIALERGGY